MNGIGEFMIIEEALKEIEAKRRMVQRWWNAAAVAHSVQAKFPEKNIHISIGWQYGQLHGVLITLWKAKNFSDTLPIFRFLGKHGYLHRGKPEEYPEIHRVTWNMEDIKFSVFFDDSDAQCKFIKTGTVMQDQYKLICPEMANP